MADTKILGICGSLRKASLNMATLRAAGANAPAGVTLNIANISDIPVYNEEIYAEGFPPAVDAFRAQIKSADALLFATPEYNYSIPGVLKNAIDWASRPPEHPFTGKAVGMLGCSAGTSGTMRAQYHLRQVMVFLDMRPINKPEVFLPTASNLFDDNGNLTDDAMAGRLTELLTALAAWSKQVS
jgi:chromate reductase